MKHIRASGVCLAIVFALAGVAAASASAAEPEPALYECAKLKKNKSTKKFEGQYEKGCTTKNSKGEGKYEVKEGIGKGKVFHGSGKGADLAVAGLGGLSCTAFKDEGKFTSPTTVGKVKVTFTGCELLTRKCNSEGAKAGEIKPFPLKGEVGYINKAKHEVGIDLTAESGMYEAEVQCKEYGVRVFGSVIGRASPINEFSKTAKLVFNESAGRQEVQNLEGMPTDVLETETNFEGGKWGNPGESGEATEAINKGELLELKA
jgi:hypothetical protein